MEDEYAIESVLDSVWNHLCQVHGTVTTNHLLPFVEMLETSVGADPGFLSSDPTIRQRIGSYSKSKNTQLSKQDMLRIMCDDVLLEIKIVDVSNSVVYGSFHDDSHVYVDTTGDIMTKSLVILDDDIEENHNTDDDDDVLSVSSNILPPQDFLPLAGLGIARGSNVSENTISPGVNTDFDSVPESPSSAWSSIAFLESLDKHLLPILPGMIEDLKLHHGRNMAQYRVLEDELDRLTDQNVHDWYRLRQLNTNNESLASRIRSIRHEVFQISKELNIGGVSASEEHDQEHDQEIVKQVESKESLVEQEPVAKDESLVAEELVIVENDKRNTKNGNINIGAIVILLLCAILRYIG